MSRKLVSVITGTYNRPELIRKCIENVCRQTYPNVEHCIVSDGPDASLAEFIAANRDVLPHIKFIETGRQWSQFLAYSISAVPYQVAQWLASGDYLCWLADDEDITEDYIESLVDLLEAKDVDFVYSKSEIWFNPELRRAGVNVIGTDPPECGQITQALFRAELLDYRGFMTHVGSGTDWDQISTWMDYGASWAFLPEIKHSHRVDKLGDVNARRMRQSLKGRKHVSS